MAFEYRDTTDAELDGVVGGLSWGAAAAASKIVREPRRTYTAAAPSFRGAVAAGTPPAAGPAKAPRCAGPWCSA